MSEAEPAEGSTVTYRYRMHLINDKVQNFKVPYPPNQKIASGQFFFISGQQIHAVLNPGELEKLCRILMAPTPAQKDSDPKRILIQDTGKQDPDLREFHGPDPRRTLPHLNGDFPAHTSHLLFKALAELLQAQIAEIAVFQGGLLPPVCSGSVTFFEADWDPWIRILDYGFGPCSFRQRLSRCQQK
jgi:hypothetical protein